MVRPAVFRWSDQHGGDPLYGAECLSALWSDQQCSSAPTRMAEIPSMDQSLSVHCGWTSSVPVVGAPFGAVSWSTLHLLCSAFGPLTSRRRLAHQIWKNLRCRPTSAAHEIWENLTVGSLMKHGSHCRSLCGGMAIRRRVSHGDIP